MKVKTCGSRLGHIHLEPLLLRLGGEEERLDDDALRIGRGVSEEDSRWREEPTL